MRSLSCRLAASDAGYAASAWRRRLPRVRCYAFRLKAQDLEPGRPRDGGWPRLVMLRHGATTAPFGTYLGSRGDLPLSARGAEQARVAGVRLAGRTFSIVLVSPLMRARETVMLALPAIDPIVDERLRELDIGGFTGLTWKQIKARDRDAARSWRAGSAAPGGEPAGQMWRRAVELGLELATRLPAGGDALLVAHNGPIRALRGSARGLSPADVRHLRVPHGGFRSIRLTPEVLERWRDFLAQELPK